MVWHGKQPIIYIDAPLEEKNVLHIAENIYLANLSKDCIAEDAIMKALDQMGSKIETDDTKRD